MLLFQFAHTIYITGVIVNTPVVSHLRAASVSYITIKLVS